MARALRLYDERKAIRFSLEGLFWRLLVRPFLPSNPKRREWTAEPTRARADAGCRSGERGCGFDDGRTLCDEGSQALVFGVGPKLISGKHSYFRCLQFAVKPAGLVGLHWVGADRFLVDVFALCALEGPMIIPAWGGTYSGQAHAGSALRAIWSMD